MKWIDELASHDYVILDDFISTELFATIMDFFSSKREEEEFRKAGVGSLHEFSIAKEIRGDFIHWVDDENCKELNAYFGLVQDVVKNLNRYCYLGLTGYEFHLAVYPPGTFYKRHLDQFRGRNNRTISMILYLNSDWQDGDGGELRIFKDDEEITISPIARRCVIFKSDVLEHEVLETSKDRYSITGWLLKHPSRVGYLVD